MAGVRAWEEGPPATLLGQLDILHRQARIAKKAFTATRPDCGLTSAGMGAGRSELAAPTAVARSTLAAFGGAPPGSSIAPAKSGKTAAFSDATTIVACITTAAADITPSVACDTPSVARIIPRVARITPSVPRHTPRVAGVTPELQGVSHGLARVMHESAGVSRVVIGALQSERVVMQIVAVVMSGSGVCSPPVLRLHRGDLAGPQRLDAGTLFSDQLSENPEEGAAVRLIAEHIAELLLQPAVCALRIDCVSWRAQSQHNSQARGNASRAVLRAHHRGNKHVPPLPGKGGWKMGEGARGA